MTAKEDKKTSVFAKTTPRQAARVGRVPGLILAQRWGRPSLAGGVCALILPILRDCCISFSMTSYKRWTEGISDSAPKKNGVSAGAILLEFSKSYGYVIGRNGSSNDC